jgi:hypothetical protein
MPVKDRIVTWFIQHVLLPKIEIIDNQGYIVNTFSYKNQTTYLREIFLPELLFELIENKIVQQYGDQGKQALYSAGKKFGYVYSSMSGFPTIKNVPEKELLDFAYFFVRFVECTFAQQANHEIDFESKSFHVFLKNFVICRHNGLGYFMADGGIAGIWAYVVQDMSIEGKQLECQGRGYKECHVFVHLKKKLNCLHQNIIRKKLCRWLNLISYTDK